MPKYDFTTIIDRNGKDAFALDAIGKLPGMAPAAPKEGFEPIPMWVADMGFATVPTIQEAIMERASHNLYGYYLEPDAYSASIIRWQEVRNGVTELTKDCIGYEKRCTWRRCQCIKHIMLQRRQRTCTCSNVYRFYTQFRKCGIQTHTFLFKTR